MDKSRIKPQAFLSKVALFNSMRACELDRIALGTTEVHVDRGGIVFGCGDPCVGFHVVVYGQVKLSFLWPNGAEKVIELVGPGHSFGEALMFMEKDYIVSAQAVDDTMLLHVAKPVIFREIADDPGFACKLLAGLSQRMHGLMRDMESISLRSGTQRVAAYLLKDFPEESDAALTTTLPVTKAVVASRLNLTPEHFSRIMADLSARKLIAFLGRRIDILDATALRRCAA